MKYYVITEHDEKYLGLQYHTGLLEDLHPSTGHRIWFSPVTNVLAYIDHGHWIREVFIPDGEEISKYQYGSSCYSAYRVILGERERITLDVIKRLVNEGADIHAGNERTLRMASRTGDWIQ